MADLKMCSRLGVVVHICNPSIRELGQKDYHKFKASLFYSERACLRQTKKEHIKKSLEIRLTYG